MGPVVTFSTVVEMFDNITSKFLHSERPMLMHRVAGAYRSITYAEMRRKVKQFVLGLAAIGVGRGDRVALISENRPEWVVADIAIMKLGAVNVSIFPTLTPKQIEYILNDSCATHVIVSNQLQLQKIVKIHSSVRSLHHIVVLSDSVTSDDSCVYTPDRLREAGESFRALHPNFIERELPPPAPDDLLTLIYTSGTTGNPRGVMLTHRNLVSNMTAAAACIPFTTRDVLLSYLPLSHSYERMGGYYTAMSCGATIAYADSIETVRENIRELRPTVVTTVPRLFERLHDRVMKRVGESSRFRQLLFRWAIEVGKDYARANRPGRAGGGASSLLALRRTLADALVLRSIRDRMGGRMRFFVSGGAALSKQLGEFFEALGILILEGYGMTESSPVISVNRSDDYKFGTVGKPLPGVEVRIAEDGEILVRGPNVMQGYWNDPEATRQAIEPEGWLHTGDIGRFDENGFLAITDRKKHLFVSSGGKNIAPQQIENLFAQSSFIDQFVLIGDGRTYLTALIVPNYDTLKDFARQRDIPFTTVEELADDQAVRELLETELGKIQKDLATYERVRKFTILKKPLTVESGELTPTMKVRRGIVEEKFKPLIERMYEGAI